MKQFTRRDFLKAVSVAAAAGVVSSCASSGSVHTGAPMRNVSLLPITPVTSSIILPVT
ncbi:twin-arginine translocation signal domain-containing protein [Pseudoalteromonas sp. 2CM28B]|uniref:twin-arginine translocation signal domain-containing protein n=1 Tax=Pseudoalteromonas sp. 2CM28B TaxID=2929851 RepID=UPI0020C12244|nr:twin-arginine translocation signal domain-containing protein [Pseudoalteromonas sp. 2CM28B]MCK8134128.1 twin-arginine translocation signal domain-containing protein [Pseudoalteromonas sp. 2CM28B]